MPNCKFLLLAICCLASCSKPDSSELLKPEDFYFKGTVNGIAKDWVAPYDYQKRNVDSFISNSYLTNRYIQTFPTEKMFLGVSSLILRVATDDVFEITLEDSIMQARLPDPSFFLPKLKVAVYPYSVASLTPFSISSGFSIHYRANGVNYNTTVKKQNTAYFSVTKLEPLPNDTLFNYVMEAEFSATAFNPNSVNDTLRLQGKFRNIMLPRK